MSHVTWMWIAFNAIVGGMLYLDLFVFNRKAHVVTLREAALWWSAWVSLALFFCGGIALTISHQKAMEFLAGYLIEQSLSVDNMFVFILIFSYFNVPASLQPRVLKWGILGAVVMRFLMIFLGSALVRSFHWVLYVFGAILLWSAYKMAFGGEQDFNPEKNGFFRLVKRIIPVTGFHQENFFVKQNGKWWATTLFLTLVVVEFSDLVFALDSIPAIFAITTDTFIVYTSNVFAILGLRSLYFLVSGLVGIFQFLKYGVALILAFVGMKMLAAEICHVPIAASLGVIGGTIAGSILLSIFFSAKKREG